MKFAKFAPKSQKSPKIAQIAQSTPKIAKKMGVFQKISVFDFLFFYDTTTYGLTTGAGIFQKKYKKKFGAEKKVFSKIQRGDHWKICQFSLGPPFGFRVWNFFSSFSPGLRGCDDGIIARPNPAAQARRRRRAKRGMPLFPRSLL